jgi:hypothetical protein
MGVNGTHLLSHDVFGVCWALLKLNANVCFVVSAAGVLA